MGSEFGGPLPAGGNWRVHVSTQTLVNPHWVGPSVVAHLAPDSTPDKAGEAECCGGLWLLVCGLVVDRNV